MLDLLSEPLLRVNGHETLSLPEVFARLAEGEAMEFDRLRPHQHPGWHAFLVQLAYHCLDLAGQDEPPCRSTDWHELLLRLTPDPSAWHLVSEDWGRPAFLQAPCPAPDVAQYRDFDASAQSIDFLPTSKNFDEKSQKVSPLTADVSDVVVYALVHLQGWVPYGGGGGTLKQTMRMNGGSSSRSQFRLVQRRGFGEEWKRDLKALLAQRAGFLLPQEPGDIGTGRSLRLLWIEVWGAAPLQLMDVHPLCLEVSRKVRLCRDQFGHMILKRSGCKFMRVDAAHLNGNVRDPWAPVVLDGDQPRALTATRGVLGYKSLAALLFKPEYCRLPLLAKFSPTDERGAPASLIAQVLVSGNSKTDGLERREIPVPGKALSLLATGDARLGLRARQQVERAGAAWGKVLRSTLIQYLDGSAEVSWKHADFARIVEPWSARWDAAVDAEFFDSLFADLDASNDDADARWIERLAGLTRQHFATALASLPTRSASPRMAAARAERLLHNGWRKQFNAALHATPENADAAHA